MVTVPSLSLRDYTEGSPATRIRFLLDLEDALRVIGFVRFRDHGIPPRLLKEFYELLRVFFVDWSEEMRMRFEQRGNGRQRGYGPLLCEHAKGTNQHTQPDGKCFFSTGVVLTRDHPRYTEIPPNIYPEIPNFRRINDTVYRNLMRVANVIFRAVSEILGMGPDWLPNICKSGDCMNRGLYYPGTRTMPSLARARAAVLETQWRDDKIDVTEEMKELLHMLKEGEVPQGTQRSHKHTDIDVGTILPRASAKGLVAITRTGEHVAISGSDDEVMYQNGDTTEDFSGGYLLSAEHYVKNPDVDPEEDRINDVVFLHADRDEQIDIVPTMLEHATKSVNPMTERKKLITRLHEIGHVDIPMPER